MAKPAEHDPLDLCFAGADPATGNLGVSALCVASVSQLSARLAAARWTLFDYGRGIRPAQFVLPDVTIGYTACGLYQTRRIYRQESLARARLARYLGYPLSPGLGRLCRSVAALDISGGDSFTDLYGTQRFRDISGIKRLALDSGTPLILLPQTFGPFRTSQSRAIASAVVSRCAAIWARDARSFEVLRDLLGREFDPTRHHCGVDVAFLLPSDAKAPPAASHQLPQVGVNVSGLIWKDPAAARSRYSFKADYRRAITTIVERLATFARVVLIPHVLTPKGHYESDRDACEDLLSTLPERFQARVSLAPDPPDPCRAKSLIARCDWFLGTRMHATIAALSSGTPSAAISYSDKTLGVFETCGQGEHVHDPRNLCTDELVERALWSFRNRDSARISLARALPAVIAQARHQMDQIGSLIRQLPPRPVTARSV